MNNELGQSMQSVGTLLWDLRQSAKLSLGELARQSGVSKAALSRWESGERIPRIPELESVLTALQVDTAQRARLLATIETPRALRQLRQTAVVPPPTMGDLLRALRSRKRWSQEQLANALNVSRVSVVRWENGERVPSTEQIQMICYALNAREEELIALTCGRFSSSKLPDGATMGDIEATLLLVQSGKLRGMEELLYWTMARQAWEMPARDPALLTLLTEIYLFTAQHSRLHERWTEIPPYLDKATAVIGELPASSADLKLRIRLEILRATVAVHEGATLRPHRGLHILSAALERSNDLPDFQAWILSDMAKYLEMDGRTEASLEMAKKAIPVAAEAANPIEAELRQMDYGNHLLRAGRPAEALRVLPGAECIGPEVLLVRAEAEFQAENLSEAANTLQKAMEQIERENIVHLRAKAERLAARL